MHLTFLSRLISWVRNFLTLPISYCMPWFQHPSVGCVGFKYEVFGIDLEHSVVFANFLRVLRISFQGFFLCILFRFACGVNMLKLCSFIQVSPSKVVCIKGDLFGWRICEGHGGASSFQRGETALQQDKCTTCTQPRKLDFISLERFGMVPWQGDTSGSSLLIPYSSHSHSLHSHSILLHCSQLPASRNTSLVSSVSLVFPRVQCVHKKKLSPELELSTEL